MESQGFVGRRRCITLEKEIIPKNDIVEVIAVEMKCPPRR